MDTSDPEIIFDSEGNCHHCNDFYQITAKNWFPNQEGRRRLAEIIEVIKKDGKDKMYDSIIGLSGGVDSSYLAMKVKELGLRPLVVHVDAGWNSELAVSNIEAVLRYCNYDLYTHVVDWEDMRDLQLSYLSAGIANQDVPQDHIYFASLYHYAIKNDIKYILSGGNLATESIFPKSWHGSAMDAINLQAIHRKYGKGKLRNYDTISFFEYYMWYPLVKKMRAIRPLNYMPYDKTSAMKELADRTGWRSYGHKHGESLFTKIFQNYYLPEKYGYDKRRPHLSSMIVSGQITRNEALEELAKPLYAFDQLEIDIEYFCKKLRITRNQFDNFITGPSHRHTDFPTWAGRYRAMKQIQGILGKITGKRLNVYS
jgi:N-acetyl sugar amidotransferase